jgi:lysophospholipase L1-like esterase
MRHLIKIDTRWTFLKPLSRLGLMACLSCNVITAELCFGFDGVAILGDSLSTGAGTHPNLEFDSRVLWNVFNGTTDMAVTTALVPPDFQDVTAGLIAPQRLGPSTRENDGGSGWIWHNVIQVMSARALETPTLSYGYLLGRKLGFPANEILLAGENGTTSKHSWLHAARVVEARGRELPTKIVIFYTGNDLCTQSIEEIIEGKDYGQELLKSMKYLTLNGHSDPKGTQIYIPGFLPVTSFLHEPSILSHKIRLHGEEVTCQEARTRMFGPKIVDPKVLAAAPKEPEVEPEFALFRAVMPPNPVLLCPTFFGPGREDSAHQSQLANRVRSFREWQRKAVAEFNEWRGLKFPGNNISAVYVEETEAIKFDGQDVAGDCFHLSARGHAKIANAMFTKIH